MAEPGPARRSPASSPALREGEQGGGRGRRRPGREELAVREQLTAAGKELTAVREQLREANETIEAIRSGDVDMLRIGPPGEEKVYSLSTADRPYRLIVESMSEGAVTISESQAILEANPFLASMIGRPVADLVGTRVRELVAEASLPEFTRLIDVGSGESARGMVELVRPDDRPLPVAMAVSGFEMDGLRLRCLVLTDVSAQRRAEEQIRADAFYNRSLIDASVDLLAAVDRQGRITDLNAAVERVTGYSRDELVGSDFGGYFTDPDRLRGAFVRIFADGGDAQKFAADLRVRNGDVVPLLVSASLYRDAAGAAAGVLASGHDLSAITDAEAALRRSEQRLRSAAAYNRSLIEASLDPLVTIGADGQLTDVNAATELATGYSRNELIGTEFAAYFTDTTRARAGYRQAFEEGEVRDYSLDLLHRDGRTTPVLYNASVYRDPAGKPLGVLAAARDVTAIRQAEAALRESEERMRAIFDHAPIGIAELTTDRRITSVNPYYCRVIGYTREEFLSQEPRSALHADDLETESEAAEQLLSGAVSSQSEVRHFVRKDGSEGWMESIRSVIRDADGRPMRLIAVGRDVTKQRKTEEALRQSEAELRAIFDNAPVGIYELTPDGKVIISNKQFQQIVGRDASELSGRPLSEIVHPDDRAADLAYTSRLLAGEIDYYTMVKRYRRPAGEVVSAEVSRALIRAADGTPQRIVGVVRDISEQRQAEQALRESEGRLRAIIDNAPVGIGELTPDGQYLSANARLHDLLGRTDAELAGPISEIIHPDDRDADTADLRRLVDGEIGHYSVIKRYLRADGVVIWAEVGRALIRAADGTPERIVGVVRDITEQRRAEEEVRTLNAELENRVRERTAELERANRSLEAFTYSVSHDLRAPLRALSGFSEALLEEYGGSLDQTGRGYAERVIAASERMGALIDDLLQLSRVSRAEISLRPVNLSVIARALAEEIRVREPARPVRLTIQEDVWANADATLVRAVLQNLLENAWKFTGKEPETEIEFGATAAERPGQVCCYVRDNGAGFEPAYAGKLFTPFQRLHRESEFPGNGIGLASVQRIIERHGGRVWADGAVGQGATFYFTLPAVDAPSG